MRQVLFERAQDRIEPLHVADLQNEFVAPCQFRELARMRGAIGNRLFDQHVLVALQKWPRDFVMRTGRCRYRSGVNQFNEFIERFRRCNAKLFRNRIGPRKIDIVNRREFRRRNLSVNPRMVASDMTNANDANTQFFHAI